MLDGANNCAAFRLLERFFLLSSWCCDNRRNSKTHCWCLTHISHYILTPCQKEHSIKHFECLMKIATRFQTNKCKSRYCYRTHSQFLFTMIFHLSACMQYNPYKSCNLPVELESLNGDCSAAGCPSAPTIA